MADLPEGFVVDEAPPGFQVDTPGVEKDTVIASRLALPNHLRPLTTRISESRGLNNDLANTLFKDIAKNRDLSLSEKSLLTNTMRRIRSGNISPSEGMKRIVDFDTNRRQQARFALELAGMLAGGRGGRGALSSRPLTGGVLGSAAGGALGSVASESFDPSESPGTSAAVAAGAGAGGELLGAGISKLLTGGLLKKSLKPGAERLIGKLFAKGETLTPGTASNSFIVDAAENVAAGSIGGGGRIAAAREGAVRVATDNIRKFVARLVGRGTKEDLGAIIQSAVADGTTAFRDLARAQYAQVDKLTGAASVNLQSTLTRAKTFLARSQKGVVASPQANKVLRNLVQKLETTPVVDFETAQVIRSDLLSIGRSTTDLIPGKAQGQAKALAGLVDSSMTTAARGLPNNALAAWRTANALWKEGKEVFNSQVIKAIARKDPDQVFQTVIRNGRPTTIRKVRTLINDRTVWRQIQGQFADDIFRSADNPATGNISASSMLTKLKNFGDDSLKELFPRGEGEVFKRAIKELALTQGKPTASTGGVFIQLAQAGAAGTLLTFNFSVSGGLGASAIIFGPRQIAKFFTNPATAKWLTVGRTAKPGSKEAITAMSKLTALAVASGGRKQEESTNPNFAP